MNVRLAFLSVCSLALAACASQTPQRPAQPPPGYYPQQPHPPGYYPQPPQQPGAYPQQPPQQGGIVVQPPPQQAQAAQQTRPLLAPLTAANWAPESRAVLAELIAHLEPQYQNKVTGMPLQIDPDPTEVNAYATCTDAGAPFVAVTQGLLEAVDGIAQTRATDELFGTQTYAAYVNAVIPSLIRPKGRAALPPNIIPAQYVNLPQRLSRAHEMFDDIIAFTVAHELAHHYLGHTGCKGTVGPIDLLGGWRIATSIIQPLNQANETAADTYGSYDTLATGAARIPAYRWSEKGGLLLFDFLSRLENAIGATPLNPIAYFQSHPPTYLRIAWVHAAANAWYAAHPAVPRN